MSILTQLIEIAFSDSHNVDAHSIAVKCQAGENCLSQFPFLLPGHQAEVVGPPLHGPELRTCQTLLVIHRRTGDVLDADLQSLLFFLISSFPLLHFAQLILGISVSDVVGCDKTQNPVPATADLLKLYANDPKAFPYLFYLFPVWRRFLDGSFQGCRIPKRLEQVRNNPLFQIICPHDSAKTVGASICMPVVPKSLLVLAVHGPMTVAAKDHAGKQMLVFRMAMQIRFAGCN